jgi:hypothetical protein
MTITTKLTIGLTLIFSVSILIWVNILLGDLHRVKTNKDTIKQELDSTKFEFKNYKDSISRIEAYERLDKFDYVYNSFKYYNRNIKPSTVAKFIEVSEFYNLDTNKFLFNKCISQICVESGAKQYYEDGTLVVSSGNAVGISQIVPSTCFHYLKNAIPDSMRSKFIELGGTPIDFIDNYKRSEGVSETGRRIISSEGRQKCIKWLENETNNLILWGFIMRRTINRQDNHIQKALVAYNIGGGGLKQYIADGKSVHHHEYVVMIKGVMRKLNKLKQS